MVGGNIQGVEVVFLKLNFRSLDCLKAHRCKGVGDIANRLRHRMQPATIAAPARQRHIELVDRPRRGVS